MPPSASSRKRPAFQSSVQPSITSYFTTTTTFSSSAPISGSVARLTTSRTAPNEPPPSVKSGLLNVGMRIRKAVPEGLKSGTYQAQKFALTTSPTQGGVLAQPLSPRKNKREYEDEFFTSNIDTKKEQPIEQPRQIIIPRSLMRGYHAAVPRSAMDHEVIMEDRFTGDDFEEAGFLQPAP